MPPRACHLLTDLLTALLACLLNQATSNDGRTMSTEHKFVVEKLRLGKPIETSLGLHKLLGLADEEEVTLPFK